MWAFSGRYSGTSMAQMLDIRIVIMTGAKSIGTLLSKNQTMKILDMGWNDIKDAGISEIATGLQNNKSLTTLNIPMCQLSGKGNHQCIKLPLV